MEIINVHKMIPIKLIANDIGIAEKEVKKYQNIQLIFYGDYIAKIDYKSILNKYKERKNGYYILISG